MLNPKYHVVLKPLDYVQVDPAWLYYKPDALHHYDLYMVLSEQVDPSPSPPRKLAAIFVAAFRRVAPAISSLGFPRT
jgi:hypothetical protein